MIRFIAGICLVLGAVDDVNQLNILPTLLLGGAGLLLMYWGAMAMSPDSRSLTQRPR